MNKEEFISIRDEILSQLLYKPKELRNGQFIYNQFYKVLKEKGIDISFVNGTEFDCFYIDDRIPEFLTKLEKEICKI